MANLSARKSIFESLARGRLAAIVVLAGVVAGCAIGRPTLVDSPLSIEQQQEAVLQVVPRGLPRDEVQRRLDAAGIEYRASGKGSIYYLMLWKRPDGQRWHIDVALLFDPSGKLYQARAGSSSWEARADEPAAGRGGEAKAIAAPTNAAPTAASSAQVDDERVPFPKQ